MSAFSVVPSSIQETSHSEQRFFKTFSDFFGIVFNYTLHLPTLLERDTHRSTLTQRYYTVTKDFQSLLSQPSSVITDIERVYCLQLLTILLERLQPFLSTE